MIHDIKIIKGFYSSFARAVSEIRSVLKRPLTLSEKILYAHLHKRSNLKDFKRGVDYVAFKPDRVAMQDATAQMALLQFLNLGLKRVRVPTTIHCDHLIQADQGAKEDLITTYEENGEVYKFLQSVSGRYGIGFWKPGSGIIHQILLENYAFPGGLMIGTDSHTPNAGGLGMLAIGVGGADAVEVMAGLEWELKMPKLIGVKLTGKLSGWTSPKDVILKLAGILTVVGATNSIIEYFGKGADTISATGKGTISNMGAEVGATASVFPYDSNMEKYLRITGRKEVADLANSVSQELRADKEILESPELYYDRIIEIDLSTLEPHINGPSTPDRAIPISEFAQEVINQGYSQEVKVGLIGSCTNSSYEDISRSASIVNQFIDHSAEIKTSFIVNPGSELIRATIGRDKKFAGFKKIGATIMANACGPCIGQWKRPQVESVGFNSILTSFNRNFTKRIDGNPDTLVFLASPEIVTAISLVGNLCFNPLTDSVFLKDNSSFKLTPPKGEQLPVDGFVNAGFGYVEPSFSSNAIPIDPKSERLQILEPFTSYMVRDFENMCLLIKVSGKCTTDHISMAGSWLRYRGHLENISNNLLMGAVNAFNNESNKVWNQFESNFNTVANTAKQYKEEGISSVIVAEDNYGEGSSREHAAMEPRFLNVRVVLTKSFARIHETNLKKQGILALTFTNADDYNKIEERDKFSVLNISELKPGNNLFIKIEHIDNTSDQIEVSHSYNEQQLSWFYAGSALNTIRNGNKNS